MANPDSVKLEPLAEENQFRPDYAARSSLTLSPADWRENTKLLISGLLSLLLLLAIGYVIWWQCSNTGTFAQAIANAQDEAGIAQSQQAIASVNDTAKGLYTFLAPLATAMATYFFAQQQSSTDCLINHSSL